MCEDDDKKTISQKDNLKVVKIENKNKSDKRLKKLSKYLDKPPFKMLLVGSSGSGKTNFLLNLFTKNFYGKKLFKKDNIVVISPSADIDPKIKMIPSNNFFTEFSEEIINEMIDQQQSIAKYKGKKKMDHLLLVLEDCLDTNAFSRNGLIEKICYRIRHFNISIIITCQKVSAIPRGLRCNTTSIVLFKCYNESEYTYIVEEYVKKPDRHKMYNMITNIMKTPYNFLYIDNILNNGFPSKFREGLTKFIMLDDYDKNTLDDGINS